MLSEYTKSEIPNSSSFFPSPYITFNVVRTNDLILLRALKVRSVG